MALSPVSAGCCAVCRRMESGIGYAPKGRLSPNEWAKRVVWVCEECAKEGLTSVIGQMNKQTLNKLESECLMTGGEAGGAYLDKLGRTDLAQLDPTEWQAFLETVLNAYGAEMRKRVLEMGAPF